MDVYAAFAEVGVLHELGVEGDGGVDGADFVFVECSQGAVDGFFAGVGMDDEFADHGVVVWRDAVACGDMGVDADS